MHASLIVNVTASNSSLTAKPNSTKLNESYVIIHVLLSVRYLRILFIDNYCH